MTTYEERIKAEKRVNVKTPTKKYLKSRIKEIEKNEKSDVLISESKRVNLN
jgi:hypothetical protein